ncbi:hypothetical protein, variant 1 [Aphanomyces invadans]|uniref:GP-PDE domain-containing protein n=1 Tax=Aphanomyces invadans TaxID=157072 RepID=A0A024TB38_9STRA|nr:hypothetical protein, variant 1 [Aphanomyces invadans]ETV90552.1 hypothetical protein, variant 1 [Aphanomyces invadans]|eukprot:XP_008880801.1 hypothetical protein, variant 1 [Aphanomyces invadans]
MRFIVDVVASFTPAATHRVCVLGNVPELGAWDPRHAVLLQRQDGSTTWTAHVDVRTSTAIEYKYAITSIRDNAFVVWESLPTNRSLDPGQLVRSQREMASLGDDDVEVHDGWFGLDTSDLGDCSKLHVEARHVAAPQTRLVFGSLVGRAPITLFDAPRANVHVAVRIPREATAQQGDITLWPHTTSFRHAVDTSVPLHALHAKLLGNSTHHYSLHHAGGAPPNDIDALREMPVFMTLDDHVLADVAAALDHVSFQPGQDIVVPGQPRRYCHWITQGHADVCGQRTTEGQHVYLQLTPRSYFGEMALFGGVDRTSHIRVSNNDLLSCVRLDRAAFLTILAKHGLCHHALLQPYVQRLAAQQPQLRQLVSGPSCEAAPMPPLDDASLQVFTIHGTPAYFRLDIMAHPSNDLVGSCMITRSQVAMDSKQSQGILTCPILAPGQHHVVVGEAAFQYLHVRPHIHPANAVHASKPALENGLPAHATSGVALDIGHRGLGRSYYQKLGHRVSSIRENTLPSFMIAGFSGADMVEFDVQLSKDCVPIVYHDFFFKAKLGTRVAAATVMTKMGLHDLTLAELNQIEWRHCVEPTPSRLRSLVRKHMPSLVGRCRMPTPQRRAIAPTTPRDADRIDMPDLAPSMQALCDAFPTLRLALDHVPLYVGFNIEIKYPMELENRHLCALPAFELNAYVDAILDVVFECGRSRHIVFSCFAPDVCVLLRAKQTKHRVLFLTCGTNVRWAHDRTDLDGRASMDA